MKFTPGPVTLTKSGSRFRRMEKKTDIFRIHFDILTSIFWSVAIILMAILLITTHSNFPRWQTYNLGLTTIIFSFWEYSSASMAR